jgi:hypothetical protein
MEKLSTPIGEIEYKPTNNQGERDDSTLKLDELGPVVINEDGSISRILNWNKMNQAEKDSTMRIIGKRNQQRISKLNLEQELK